MIKALIPQAWQSDRQLLQRALEGHKPSSALIVQRLTPDAYGLAWRMLGKREDAQDLVQDAFIRLWRAGGSFSGEASLRTYFHTLVTRLCIDHLRKNSKHSGLEFDDGIAESAYLDDGQYEAQLDDLYEVDAELLKESLNALPSKQRMALVLWAYYDKTAEEIAVTLEMNKNSVDQLLFRAKNNLKKRITGAKEHA